jgi:hypothetical protein
LNFSPKKLEDLPLRLDLGFDVILLDDIFVDLAKYLKIMELI